MPNFAMKHVNRFRSVAQSRNGPERIGVASRITRFWIRCLDELRLAPGTCAETEVIPAAELRERQDRLAGMRAVAKVEIADSALDKLQFGDAVMAANVEKAKRVVEQNAAIMLPGETGTGKEMVERALYASDRRASQPFIAIPRRTDAAHMFSMEPR